MNVSSILIKALAQEIKTTYGVDFTAHTLEASQLKELDRHLIRVLDEYGSRDDLYRNYPCVYEVSSSAKKLMAVRTLLNYRYKVEVAPSKDQIKNAQESFLDRNSGCADWARKNVKSCRSALSDDYSELNHSDYLTKLIFVARRLCHARVSRYRNPGKPNHGPGVTSSCDARRISKYESIARDVPASLVRFSPWFVPSPSFLSEFQPLGWPSVCKLSAVPKDARGPRLIAPHSAAHMWMQQAVRDRLCSLLVSDDKWYRYHPLFDERLSTIQFDDQLVNAGMALYGSAQPMLVASLDLSDASDRIPWLLVRTLMPPRLAKDLTAVRARSIQVGAVNHRLHMHAPMGSACCFPVLALVCWSVCCASIWLRRHELNDLSEAIPSDFDSVWVYGDDIITSPDNYQSVTESLALCNLTVSQSKSFVGKGGFRESCGIDAFNGEDVTPVRLRVDGVSSVQDLLTLVSHANSLRREGFEQTAKACRDLIQINACELGVRHLIAATPDELYSSTCVILDETSARAWNRQMGVVSRLNKKLQRREVRCLEFRTAQGRVNSDLDSRSRLFEGTLGNRASPASGWALKRPRVVTAWVPFW